MLETTEINKERALNQENMFIHVGSFMMDSDKFYPKEKPGVIAAAFLGLIIYISWTIIWWDWTQQG